LHITRALDGVDYAKHWKDVELRFFDKNSAAVSKTRRTMNVER